ncbi:signal peptidase I [Bacillus lacus]|uniref:Signal peptidase I n=1 Tax=Metabacillus lacus TaxID=1983721 RepID=A0A7X2LXU2_9BACI|nr:signal peptidase I [Metabacillus lacus]MRX71078.1 signal peptidase I [Metabacillus lacus]
MTTQTFLKEALSWGKTLLIGFTLALLISIFLVQPFTVSGSSMEPTFQGSDPAIPGTAGDRVFVYKSAYLFEKTPQYGDMVIVDSRLGQERNLGHSLRESPLINWMTKEDQEHFWIKRVIGRPGDTIGSKNHEVYRNGELLHEDYIKEAMNVPFEAVTVPEGHVFIMGDNRNHSIDSRVIGPVPLDHLLGKVFFKF